MRDGASSPEERTYSTRARPLATRRHGGPFDAAATAPVDVAHSLAEQDLAREFDVSVGTMRCVIQMLVGEGHVSRAIRAGDGSLVDLVQLEPDSCVRLVSRRRLVPPPEVRLSLGDGKEAVMLRVASHALLRRADGTFTLEPGQFWRAERPARRPGDITAFCLTGPGRSDSLGHWASTPP
ncbi:MAG TPA: hypothetical protein VIM86_03595 [Thermodesulfobacteriota bacterium]